MCKLDFLFYLHLMRMQLFLTCKIFIFINFCASSTFLIWFCFYFFYLYTSLFYQINGIFFIDLNLVACDFLKLDWFKTINSYAGFSINIFSLRMSVVSVKTLEYWICFKSNLDYVELLCFLTWIMTQIVICC